MSGRLAISSCLVMRDHQAGVGELLLDFFEHLLMEFAVGVPLLNRMARAFLRQIET